jgi:hypothetical protein
LRQGDGGQSSITETLRPLYSPKTPLLPDFLEAGAASRNSSNLLLKSIALDDY